MTPNGYAIVDGNGAVVATCTSLPDRIAWPDGAVTQPAALMAHGGWSFVERWDDLPAETRTQKPGSLSVGMAGGKLVQTAALVDKTPDEIAAWDAARIPAPVNALHFRLALLEAGLLAAVESYVAGAPKTTQLAWAFHGEVEYDNPLVQAAAAGLGVSDTALRALFVRAAAIEPGR